MTCRWFRLASLLGFLGAALISRAQETLPLHAFFQQNFDSTIVYQSGSTWNNSPNYLILAKYQSRLEFFTYTSPYRDVLGHYYPGQLTKKLAREESLFRATVPDTNRYLVPKRIAEETLRQGWQRLNLPKLWAIRGDQQARRPMGNCVIEDGEENTFYLIDKKSIRVAHFYAPAFYEACEGKDVNRQLAIQASNTLSAFLQLVR